MNLADAVKKIYPKELETFEPIGKITTFYDGQFCKLKRSIGYIQEFCFLYTRLYRGVAEISIRFIFKVAIQNFSHEKSVSY